MNGLPADTNVNFLRARRLSDVGVSSHEVILRLKTGDPYLPVASIHIESSVRLAGPGGEELITDESPQIASALLPLLDGTVKDVSILPPGTLRLIWSTGHILDVCDSVENYESYHITNGDDVIVV